MPASLSTRAVGSPLGTKGQFSPTQHPDRFVPLSVFFLNMQGQADGEAEDTGLYGFKKPSKKPSKVRAKQTRQTSPKNSKGGAKSSGGADGRTQGGDSKQASSAMGDDDKDKGQSTASSQESVTMATGTPLSGPSKRGATRAQSGAMGSGNVAQYPVPIGAPLRRTAPIGSRKKKKKKKRSRRKKTEEARSQWIERLGTLMQE